MAKLVKKIPQLLICSLILNLVFFMLSSLLVYRRGGVPFLISKMAPTPLPSSPTKFIGSPSYFGRKDTYARLPRMDAAIVFAGDSITDLCVWHELLQRPVLNRGISGDTIEGLRLRIEEVLQHHPRQLFIMIGINDLFSSKTSDEVWVEYQRLVSQIRATSPQTRLFIQTVLPVNTGIWKVAVPPHLAASIIQINKKLSEIADGKYIVYIDLYSHMVAEENQLDKRYTWDGVHLNGAGYAQWRELLYPYLSSVSRPPAKVRSKLNQSP